MVPPRLTFFCELNGASIGALFSTPNLIDDLLQLKAGVSMGLVDLSPERASVVRKLNNVGVPVIAWLLLPEEHGYWFNMDNLLEANHRYDEFAAWTKQNGLRWVGVGLDIESDIREMSQLAKDPLVIIPKLLNRLFDRKRLMHAETGYQELVNRIRSDGYYVESYQIPLIVDERKIGSTFIRRLGGLVDIKVDREVWMLYSSLLRPHGVGLLGSYAPQAQAIGVGVTGGGVDIEFGNPVPLTWDELARDLRLAWYWCDNIYIFSLEGCITQGFLSNLKTFQWDMPIMIPDKPIARMDSWRRMIRSVLWLSAHLWAVLISLLGLYISFRILLRWMRGKDV